MTKEQEADGYLQTNVYSIFVRPTLIPRHNASQALLAVTPDVAMLLT